MEEETELTTNDLSSTFVYQRSDPYAMQSGLSDWTCARHNWVGRYDLKQIDTDPFFLGFERDLVMAIIGIGAVPLLQAKGAEIVQTHNAPVPFMPQMDVTAGRAPLLGEHDIASLEARQQADAILQSRDLRSALAALIDEEEFSPYDLHVALGVGRSNLATWRTRPVIKLRAANAERLWRLMYAWKLWLGIGDGQPLGHYLRVSIQDGLTLLDIFDLRAVSKETLTVFIRELVRKSKDRAASRLRRRRHLSGLPGQAYGSSELP